MSDLSAESDNVLSSPTSSFSDEEELEELLTVRARPKNENYFEEIIPRYNQEEFQEHFRVSRYISDSIAERFQESEYFKRHAGCYGKLSPSQETLIYLWYAGHQTASFRDVADRFNITISSLHRIIQRFTYFLSDLSPEVIKWPNEQERNDIEIYFRHHGFPGVIGIIDGSHVKIDKPSDDPDSYINRKGFYSMQMQLVCDHQLQIRDVFVGYPGSVHDSRVFRSSPLSNALIEKCENYYILGDSGYPLLPNLMVPFKDRGQLTRAQQNYNVQLAKNRYLIEHCFGLLKQKFRQLYHLKLRKIVDIAHFTRACCVLHNLALNDNFPLVENEEENIGIAPLNPVENEADNEPEDRYAAEVRNRIVNLLRQ